MRTANKRQIRSIQRVLLRRMVHSVLVENMPSSSMCSEAKRNNLTPEAVHTMTLQIAQKIGARYGIRDVRAFARTLTTIVALETGDTFNPFDCNQKSDARGLVQMKVGTQREVSKRAGIKFENPDDIFNPQYALTLAAHEVAHWYNKHGRSWTNAVKAYHIPGALRAKPTAKHTKQADEYIAVFNAKSMKYQDTFAQIEQKNSSLLAVVSSPRIPFA
jgi:hypothetical protein